MRVTWLVHKCDMTRVFEFAQVPITATPPSIYIIVHMCHVTHSYVCDVNQLYEFGQVPVPATPASTNPDKEQRREAMALVCMCGCECARVCASVCVWVCTCRRV